MRPRGPHSTGPVDGDPSALLAMLGPMLRAPLLLLITSALLTTSTDALAQRTLEELKRTFGAQRDELYADKKLPTQAQEEALRQQQQKALEQFLTQEAKGNDRWLGALYLAEMRMRQRDRDGAKQALLSIDAEAAPAMVLLNTADQFARLGDKARRDALVQKALAKPCSLEERLDLAEVLMTLLREVAAGEKIFADALAAATDDEARAAVRWRYAETLRGREDLPENAYFDALEKLAKELPSTYWGSVARDRNLASQFKLGSDSIAFRATTTENTKVESTALRGRAVLLVFWHSGEDHAKGLVAAVQTLRKQHGDDLFVLGIALDEDPQAFRKAATQLGATFLQVCDGKGAATDLAVRYGVEITPTMLAIDRKGRIAGLNLHVDTQDARDEVAAALQRALARD